MRAILLRACGVRNAGEVKGRPDVLTLAEKTALRAGIYLGGIEFVYKS
jgi:hypothetical protein